MSVGMALLLAVVAICVVVFLIERVKLNPFLALLIASMLLGFAAGMPASRVVSSFEGGAGQVLGQIASVIALGTMLGKMLEVSGGADRIAMTVVALAGPRRLDWAMMVIGLLVGLSVFFTVGFVILVPLAFSIARQTGRPILHVALPVTAALSVVQGYMPPHPGTMFALAAYHADIGRVIWMGAVVSVPVAIISGPLYTRFIVPRLPADAGMGAEHDHGHDAPRAHADLPGFGITLFTILAPIVLMLAGSATRFMGPTTGDWVEALRFVGDPNVGLALAALLSFWTLGLRRGLTREKILACSNECLGPLASLLLMIGAGGGFGAELMDSGISDAIARAAVDMHVPLLFLAWGLAAGMRVAVGSATVAMSTTAGIVAPIMVHGAGASPELLVLATGAGAVMFGPMNDSGFWQVRDALGLTVPQTLRTWSVIETLIGVVGLGMCLLLGWCGL
ncbi:high-affinity gluconate transporter [Komagataeibacter europaeus]|uniref:High-affinity gluconate transporter n=1 Tax=Komagataeibacter europaeus TaxID=33995 RepID=A0A0M0EI98_KOMEU|nr:gluconate:H+ symporter [Komagataeibacter europaeus]KON64965.1 high-affinity gluconate transporter [Komagataeibacter europaeus]GBQ40726.1 gluconate permease [Komagataeibacter europaeus LMG 18890]